MKHWVDHLECLIDLLTDFCTSQDNLTTDEDQKDDLRFDHAIDETREQFRLIRAEIVMATSQPLKTNWELDVTGADNVLDLEVGELGIKAEFLDDASVFARGQLRIILGLGTSDNHLAGSEDERSRLGFTDTHDDSREPLKKRLAESHGGCRIGQHIPWDCTRRFAHEEQSFSGRDGSQG